MTIDGVERERFLSRVHMEPNTGCWLWVWASNEDGYGHIKRNGRTELAHRVAYEMFIGAIPRGLVIDHVRARGCSGAACVNPAHLEAVTTRENNARAQRRRCIRGHELSKWNATREGGRVVCRTCAKERRAVAWKLRLRLDPTARGPSRGLGFAAKVGAR